MFCFRSLEDVAVEARSFLSLSPSLLLSQRLYSLSLPLSPSVPLYIVFLQNLKTRIARMKQVVNPLFADITWGAGGSTSDLSMELAAYMQSEANVTANLHMTCTNIIAATGGDNDTDNNTTLNDPVDNIRTSLRQAAAAGVNNIVALRGDPPAGVENWQTVTGGFNCALDLVKFIRSCEANHDFRTAAGTATAPHHCFGISVAGYPEGHPVAITPVSGGDAAAMTPSEAARSSVQDGVTYTCRDEAYAKELAYLKAKVDAGAGASPRIAVAA